VVNIQRATISTLRLRHQARQLQVADASPAAGPGPDRGGSSGMGDPRDPQVAIGFNTKVTKVV
jgi:hypothetical protein